MNYRTVRLRAPLLATLSAVTIGWTPAAAQTADTDTGTAESAPSEGLAEIVVTAQKRSENLQNVPIAVSAVSGEAVERMQAVTLQGLQGKVPAIQINNFSNTPNSAVISIRGIGVVEPDPYAGNTVSIVVDGVPQFFSMGALVDLFDIERVEILRGPQGTLFGANTTGGVVNVVTAQPTGEFSGKAQVTYGNYDRLDVSAAMNFPIVEDLLAGKIAVSHNGRDGFVTNVVTGADMGRRNNTLFRGYLKLTPAPDFDATLIGEYARARNGAPVVINGAIPGELIYAPPGVEGMYQSPCPSYEVRCNAPDKYFSAHEGVPDLSDMDTYRATLTMNWSDTAIGDITAITGYKEFKLLEYTDQDGSPLFLDDTRRRTEGWQLSQELRTAVDVTDAINLILGGFYLKTHYDHRQDFRIQFAAPGLLQINLQDQDNYSASIFAQSYIDLTERLRLQAGIRYTYEQTKMLASTATSINLSGMTDFDGTGNVPLGTVAPPRGKESWNNVGWKVGLDFQAADDVLLYGYWARGFKSGGFTGRIGIPQDLGPYDPEEVDTFEAGIKADFLDKRLRVNLAGFYTDYRDLQVAQLYFDNSGPEPVQGNTILNAGKAEIRGFELETTALPIEGLTLTGTVAYLDSEYTDFPYIDPITLVARNLKGFRLQNSPKWSATAGVTYEFGLWSGTTTASLLYSYVGEKYLSSIPNTPRSLIQATHLVDASLEWTPAAENWSLGLWARNLFDNRYMAVAFDQPPYGCICSYAPPREYGATFKVNW